MLSFSLAGGDSKGLSSTAMLTSSASLASQAIDALVGTLGFARMRAPVTNHRPWRFSVEAISWMRMAEAGKKHVQLFLLGRIA